MLDRKFVVENADAVKENCAARACTADVDRFVELEQARRRSSSRSTSSTARPTRSARSIGKAKDAAEREARKEEGRRLREQVTTAAGRARSDRRRSRCHSAADSQHVASRCAGRRRTIRRTSKSAADATSRASSTSSRSITCELGEKLDLIDFEAGAKVAGHGFYFLKNDAVLLELALQRYAIDLLMKEGFTPTITPDLARNEVLQGTGFIPRGPETQIYSIAEQRPEPRGHGRDHAGRVCWPTTILDEEQLPIKVCGISHCYRTEAGRRGPRSRGLYRVHQFTKVEMFAFTLPEQSDAMLDYFCELECQMFDGLGIRLSRGRHGHRRPGRARRIASSTWKPGCPAAARRANTAK